MAVRTITTRLAIDGESEFKKSLSNVDSSLKTLKSEMSLVDAQFKGQANSQDALTEKHRVLSEEIAQQEEKVRALEQAVADANDAYDDGDKRIDSYQQKLNRAKSELIKLNDELDTNDRYLDEAKNSSDKCAKSIDEFGREVKDAVGKTDDLTGAVDDLGKEMDDAERKSSTFGDMLKASLASDAIKSGIKGIGSAITALPTAVVRELADGFRSVYDSVREMSDAAGDIDDAAKRVGTTAEEYQKWSYAAKLGGMEVSKLESLMVKQQKSFSDAHEGVKATAEAYERLGIDINEVGDASDAFEAVLYTLADMTDETERNALANDIFGKSYADLAPLLAEGSEGIAAWRQEIVDLGGVMSNEAVEAGANFGDSLDRLQTRFDGLKNNLSGEFLPAFTDVVDGATMVLGGDVDRGIEKIKFGMVEFEATINRLGPGAEAALDAFLDEFVEHFPEIVERGADIVWKLVEGIGDSAPDIISAAAGAVNVLVNELLDPVNQKKILDAGISIGEALVKGVFSILSNLGSLAWAEIKDAFSGNPYASNAGSWNHSHASGLERVPYDNYPAVLHRDEMVLTAREAEEYRGSSGGEAQTIVIHTHVDLDKREVGKSVTEYQNNERRARGK